MSLDVYLYDGIRCHHCGRSGEPVYSANITHNLSGMASAAGIYGALWRPDEHGWTRARDLAPILRSGLTELEAWPERFVRYNASNGWGMYEHLVPFVRKYLAACEEWPDAIVRVSR